MGCPNWERALFIVSALSSLCSERVWIQILIHFYFAVMATKILYCVSSGIKMETGFLLHRRIKSLRFIVFSLFIGFLHQLYSAWLIVYTDLINMVYWFSFLCSNCFFSFFFFWGWAGGRHCSVALFNGPYPFRMNANLKLKLYEDLAMSCFL